MIYLKCERLFDVGKADFGVGKLVIGRVRRGKHG
jgi:hypothetical protein